jgi:hypothetical protein
MPDGESKARLLHSSKGRLWILDHQGKAVSYFEAPQCPDLGNAYGAFFRAERERPPYFAAVVMTGFRKGSHFYVFDAEKKLAYHETVSGNWESIAVLSSRGKDLDSILIGGLNQVWRYERP